MHKCQHLIEQSTAKSNAIFSDLKNIVHLGTKRARTLLFFNEEPWEDLGTGIFCNMQVIFRIRLKKLCGVQVENLGYVLQDGGKVYVCVCWREGVRRRGRRRGQGYRGKS